MIEINGWINIFNTTDGEDEVERLEEIIYKVRELTSPLIVLNNFFEIKQLNGCYTLFVGVNHNHDNGYSKSIYELLCEIGKIALGSYGLIYFRLPEDKTTFNKFKVYKLAKGKVTIEEDELLSPCNPIIED